MTLEAPTLQGRGSSLVDASGAVIGKSEIHSWGVDGKAFGPGVWHDHWAEMIPADVAERTASIRIIHFWYPKWGAIKNIIDQAIRNTESVITVYGKLKAAGIVN